MSDYTKTTNFATKDSLPAGDAAKKVKGTEINTEFDNIATAVNSKADSSSITNMATTTGGTYTGHLVLNDNVKAIFGTASDGLEIYHDGSNSILKDSGTGILRYESTVSTAGGSILEVKNLSSTSGTGSWVKFRNVYNTDGTAPYLGGIATDLRIYANGGESARFKDNGVQLNGTNALITAGSGTPEGSVSAAVGSLYTRTDGGANTTLYVKESGTGNTGWVAK